MKQHGEPLLDKTVVAPLSPFYEGPYGRMFRNLPAYEPRPENLAPGIGWGSSVEEPALGYFEKIAETMAEPLSKAMDPQLDGQIEAGYTYLGQFVTHDITFDPVTSLQRRNDPNMLQNFRTPRFDLDSLYGRGPQDTPYLYDYRQSDKFIFGTGENLAEQDLPRNAQDVALIGDPRNDSNIILSQLHVAFLRFHNSVVYKIETSSGLSGDDLFREAQRQVQWHYQWVVIKDYLRNHLVSDPNYVDQLLEQATQRKPFSGFTSYSWKNVPFLPLEFSAAAFRFGHSMIRSSYDINDVLGNVPLIDVPGPWGANSGQSMLGFRKLPKGFTIQWDRFFHFPGSPNAQKSRRIDTLLAAVLTQLPGELSPSRRSMAFLDLVRGWKLGLPSGQSVAKALGIPRDLILDGHDPLWYYVLREAKEKQQGLKLGPLGSAMVSEVLVGLLAGDPQSFINIERNWKPHLPAVEPGNFTMSDLLAFAEVPITKRDVELVIGDSHPNPTQVNAAGPWRMRRGIHRR